MTRGRSADVLVRGQTLTLHPERAVYWERARTLIVADTHFGKAATFRAHGLPVPVGTTTAALQRLDAVLTRTRAERLLFLGASPFPRRYPARACGAGSRNARRARAVALPPWPDRDGAGARQSRQGGGGSAGGAGHRVRRRADDRGTVRVRPSSGGIDVRLRDRRARPSRDHTVGSRAHARAARSEEHTSE